MLLALAASNHTCFAKRTSLSVFWSPAESRTLFQVRDVRDIGEIATIFFAVGDIVRGTEISELRVKNEQTQRNC